MNIASKTSDIKLKSLNPGFSYNWKNADEPIEVKEAHAEKILKNPNFYISDKAVKKKATSIQKSEPTGRTQKNLKKKPLKKGVSN